MLNSDTNFLVNLLNWKVSVHLVLIVYSEVLVSGYLISELLMGIKVVDKTERGKN